MYILTKKYKYEVFQRLLKAKESFEVACSKSGLSVKEAKKTLAGHRRQVTMITKNI